MALFCWLSNNKQINWHDNYRDSSSERIIPRDFLQPLLVAVEVRDKWILKRGAIRYSQIPEKRENLANLIFFWKWTERGNFGLGNRCIDFC